MEFFHSFGEGKGGGIFLPNKISRSCMLEVQRGRDGKSSERKRENAKERVKG